METIQLLKHKAGDALHSFTRSLIDHSYNDAKHPRDFVQSKKDAWRQATDELRADEDALDARFQEAHKNPRTQAMTAYEAFCQEARAARRAFHETKRRQDLREWVRQEFDIKTHGAALQDPIHTKYMHGV